MDSILNSWTDLVSLKLSYELINGSQLFSLPLILTCNVWQHHNLFHEMLTGVPVSRMRIILCVLDDAGSTTQ